MRITLRRNERGAALLETAITLPLILLVSVAKFDLRRPEQNMQVFNKAAREGARVAVISGTTPEQIKSAVKTYASIGGLTVTDEQISLNQFKPLGVWEGSEVTVAYPFDFMVLNPVAQLVAKGSTTGNALTMTAVAVMRNEG